MYNKGYGACAEHISGTSLKQLYELIQTDGKKPTKERGKKMNVSGKGSRDPFSQQKNPSRPKAEEERALNSQNRNELKVA